jgi:hypothetical protein
MRLATAIKAAWEKHGEVDFDLYEAEAERMAAEIVRAIPLRSIIREWLARRLAASRLNRWWLAATTLPDPLI